MRVLSDYEDMFKILNAYRIKYLVIGAYAVMYYTKPMYTKDIGVCIIPELNDKAKVYEALKKFGAPLHGIRPEDFNNKQMILQIGVAPVRIDILMDIPGISSQSAWRHKKRICYGKTPIYVLGKKDLIAAKKKVGRPQDKIDLEYLKD